MHLFNNFLVNKSIFFTMYKLRLDYQSCYTMTCYLIWIFILKTLIYPSKKRSDMVFKSLINCDFLAKEVL